MPQRTQLGHYSHQARILALHSDLLSDPNLLPSVLKRAFGFVVLGRFGGQAEAVAQREIGEGAGWWGGEDGTEGAEGEG